MKFILIRSFSGFGDRIEHVLGCYSYAKKTGRTMVIDWTDPVWCGDEYHKGFDHYMHIRNINYMSIEDFKKIFIKRKTEKVPMSFLPTFYEDILLKRSNEKDVKYKFGDITTLFNGIREGTREDVQQDVIVSTDLDKRNNRGILNISNLIYNQNVMDFIKKDPNYDFLMNNKYVAIHLRGSDRSKYTETFRPDLTNFSHHKDEYVDKLIEKIPENTENLLVLTDSVILFEIFMNKIDKKYNIIDTNNKRTSDEIGLHLIKEESKESKNLELLKDFYFMTRSSFVVCDQISRFSLVACRVCEYGKPIEDRKDI